MRTEYLLQKEVDRVLMLLTPENALIMRTALHTGLRIGDVLKLKTAELKPRFWVTESKTGKKKQVGLPEPLLRDIREQAGKTMLLRIHEQRNRVPGRGFGRMSSARRGLCGYRRMWARTARARCMRLT